MMNIPELDSFKSLKRYAIAYYVVYGIPSDPESYIYKSYGKIKFYIRTKGHVCAGRFVKEMFPEEKAFFIEELKQKLPRFFK